jgi:hypothetical protein
MVCSEMWGVGFPEPYMSLYNASALAVKSVHPTLKIGGPATMQTLDVADFIAITANSTPALPVDFVSLRAHPRSFSNEGVRVPCILPVHGMCTVPPLTLSAMMRPGGALGRALWIGQHPLLPDGSPVPDFEHQR